MSSILDDVKHMLGLLPEDTAFDSDIINFVNGAFGTLTQLGLGPVVGFQITSKLNQWSEFYTDPRMSGIRTYIFLKVKMAYDPPTTGFTQAAMERQCQELEYRLNVVADYG